MTQKTGIRALAIETANEEARVEVAQAVRLRAVALAVIYAGDCIKEATGGKGPPTITINLTVPPDDHGAFFEQLSQVLERVK